MFTPFITRVGVVIAATAVYGAVLAVWRSPLLAAFAPILWLFAVSTESIAFIVCFAIILAIVAVRFAFRPFHGAVEKGIAASAIGFKIWFVVFLVVAFQTVTLIRPMRPTSVAKDAPQGKCLFVKHFLDVVIGSDSEPSGEEK